jgi:hypothetical protein
MRREDFLRVGGFDRAMVEGREDWDLYVRMLHHRVYGRFLAEPLIRCRKHRPPRKKLVNRSKNMAAAKLFYKYPKFFWRSFCRRPLKHIYYLLFGGVGENIHQYGPSRDRMPIRIISVTL